MAKTLHVGDRVCVERRGEVAVESIKVATRPSVDPAAETHGTEVEVVDWDLPFVITFGRHWAYKDQIEKIVARGEVQADGS